MNTNEAVTAIYNTLSIGDIIISSKFTYVVTGKKTDSREMGVIARRTEKKETPLGDTLYVTNIVVMSLATTEIEYAVSGGFEYQKNIYSKKYSKKSL